MKNKFLPFLICLVILSGFLYASEIETGMALSLDHLSENSPFPIKTLDPQILAEYMPFIREEVGKEFSQQDDLRTRRNTREYGLKFFKMLNEDFTYTAPPGFFQKLGAHICKELGHKPVKFTNIILSVYDKDFHLEPHVDVNAKDLYVRDLDDDASFYFSERVYGIVIEPDETGHLYFVKWEEEGLPPLDLKPIYSLKEQAGTIFCLEGDLRKTPYYHGVSPVSNRRISITFRTVEKRD